jgi:hypothetical protein
MLGMTSRVISRKAGLLLVESVENLLAADVAQRALTAC